MGAAPRYLKHPDYTSISECTMIDYTGRRTVPTERLQYPANMYRELSRWILAAWLCSCSWEDYKSDESDNRGAERTLLTNRACAEVSLRY